jgi:hypothetical protein
VVLQAAAVPLGNGLQFLAGGFLLGLLTQRAVLVDMGELSPSLPLSLSSLLSPLSFLSLSLTHTHTHAHTVCVCACVLTLRVASVDMDEA